MIVADANLVVYLVLPGAHTEVAVRVLERDAEWAAPFLWRSEVRNVLLGYRRRGLLQPRQTLDLMERVERLMRGREFLPGSIRVLELAEQSRLSAYDCEYVALADEMDVPLVTGDRRIAEAFPERVLSPERFAGV